MLSDDHATCSSRLELTEQQEKELETEIQHQTILHWNYRRLRSLPEQLLRKGTHIRHLYLKHNLLTRLPNNLGCLKQLTYCYLHGNHLEELPESIGDVSSLQVLDVGNNNLKRLPCSLANLLSLRSLVAVYNQITDFPKELCQLRSLSVLMLSGNKLSHLPEAVAGLIGLQGLYVDHNQLRELPRALASLPMLTRISCCCNYLLYLPALDFISRPTIFYDDNSRLNYLPFSMVKQLHSGETWNPIVMQTYGCFQQTPVIGNVAQVSCCRPSTGTSKEQCLVLPLPIDTVTTPSYGQSKISSLKEICLRFIWQIENQANRSGSHLQRNKEFLNVVSEAVPCNLLNLLETGPATFCNNSECQLPLFTHASIVVIQLMVTARSYVPGNVVPSVLFFCTDVCAKNYHQYLLRCTDDFSTWLCDRLDKACIVTLI